MTSRDQAPEGGNLAPSAADLSVNVEGRTLFTRAWGNWRAAHPLPPILLMHDSLGCVRVWRDFPGKLAAATGHAVIAYDRLGFGASQPHDGTLDAEFIRDEARRTVPALRDALGIDRMILFGHSVGAAMAVASGAEWMDATVAVIAESPQAFVEDRTLKSIRDAKVDFQDPAQRQRLARYHGSKSDWVLDAWTETWLAPSFGSWSLDDDLRRLRCPLLVMHGDRDPYGSRAHPERIGKLGPTPTDVVIFEECGHVPHREHPDRVLSEVVRFLGTRLRLGPSASS